MPSDDDDDTNITWTWIDPVYLTFPSLTKVPTLMDVPNKFGED